MDVSVADISRLKTGSPEEKRALLDQLLATRSAAATELAVDALGDSDWTIRRHAAERLAGLGPPVLERLGRVLSTGDENQRYWAVRALVAIGAEAIPLLLRLLEKGPKAMRLHAATALGEIGDRVAIPHLVRSLGDKVWQVRFNAYNGLLGFGEGALDTLRAGLSGENEDRAYWCAKALGKLGEPARGTLLEALKGGARRLRFVVAAALGETGDLRVVRVLIQYTRDGSWIVRKRAADALAEIGRPAIKLIIEAVAGEQGPQTRWLLAALLQMRERGQAAVGELLVRQGEAFAWELKDDLTELGALARPVFVKLCESPDQDLRFFAASCLGELEPESSVDDALLDCLQDPCWSIRKVAADALGLRGQAIIPKLNRAMEVGNEDLRYWVSVVYRKLGDLGVDELITALQDSNSNVAYFAATSLAEVPDRRVVRPLIRALGSRSWPVRNAASTSLGLLSEVSVVPLVHSIEDEHEDVAYWVGKTLKRIGRSALPDVIRLLRKGNDEERLFAAKTLGVLRDPEAVDSLIGALSDGHEWVRLYSCVALGEIGDRRALDHLLGVLRDPKFRIHPRMAGVFLRFGDRVVPELMDMTGSEEPGTVGNALFLLGAMKVPEAFDRIKEAALDLGASESVRSAAVQALGGYAADHPGTVAALEEVLSLEGSGPLRARAVVALGEIEGDESVPGLLRALGTSEGREGEARILNLLMGRGERVLPKLIECLGHEDVVIWKASASVIEEMGLVALPYVKTAALEGDQNVRFWGKKLQKKLEATRVRPRST